MRRALIKSKDSSMYWTMTWATETAAVQCLRLGDDHLAEGVLAGLDADLHRLGGRPMSGHASTILHPIRVSLTRTRADDNTRPPARPKPWNEQLIDRLRPT